MPKYIGPGLVAAALFFVLVLMLISADLTRNHDPKPAAVLVPEATIAAPIPVGTQTPAYIWPRHCRVVETRTYANTTGADGVDNRGTETITTEITCEP